MIAIRWIVRAAVGIGLTHWFVGFPGALRGRRSSWTTRRYCWRTIGRSVKRSTTDWTQFRSSHKAGCSSSGKTCRALCASISAHFARILPPNPSCAKSSRWHSA